MEWEELARALSQQTDTKIVLLVMDGVGGLPADGQSELEDALVGVWRPLAVDALGPARQDQGRRLLALDRRERRRVGLDLRVDAEFADLPGDELGVLRPEIEDEDFLHAGILAERRGCFNLC